MNAEDSRLLEEINAVTALVPSDPRVITVARRFGWRPTTVIARITQALPAVTERQLYLEVAKDYGMRPESFAIIIRNYLGARELTSQDLEERGVAKELVNFLLQTLSILSEDKEEWDIRIGTKIAARLATQFGDDAITVIDGIYANIDEITELMGWTGISDRKIMRMAIAHILETAETGSNRGGWDVMSYFDNGLDHTPIFE